MNYMWLMPLIPVLGVACLLAGFHFFPYKRPSTGQMELDLGGFERPERRVVMNARRDVQILSQEIDAIRDETKRLKDKPRP